MTASQSCSAPTWRLWTRGNTHRRLHSRSYCVTAGGQMIWPAFWIALSYLERTEFLCGVDARQWHGLAAIERWPRSGAQGA